MVSQTPPGSSEAPTPRYGMTRRGRVGRWLFTILEAALESSTSAAVSSMELDAQASSYSLMGGVGSLGGVAHQRQRAKS